MYKPIGILLALVYYSIGFSQEYNYRLTLEVVNQNFIEVVLPNAFGGSIKEKSLFAEDTLIHYGGGYVEVASWRVGNTLNTREEYVEGYAINYGSFFRTIMYKDALDKILDKQFGNLFSEIEIETIRNSNEVKEIFENPISANRAFRPFYLDLELRHRLEREGYYKITRRSSLLSSMDIEAILKAVSDKMPEYINLDTSSIDPADTLTKDQYDGEIKIQIEFKQVPSFGSEDILEYEGVMCITEMDIIHNNKSIFVDYRKDNWLGTSSVKVLHGSTPMEAFEQTLMKWPMLKFYSTGYLKSFRHPRLGLSVAYKNYLTMNGSDHPLTYPYEPFFDLFFDADLFVYPYLSLNYSLNLWMYISQTYPKSSLGIGPSTMDKNIRGSGDMHTVGIKGFYPINRNLSSYLCPGFGYFNYDITKENLNSDSWRPKRINLVDNASLFGISLSCGFRYSLGPLYCDLGYQGFYSGNNTEAPGYIVNDKGEFNAHLFTFGIGLKY